MMNTVAMWKRMRKRDDYIKYLWIKTSLLLEMIWSVCISTIDVPIPVIW